MYKYPKTKKSNNWFTPQIAKIRDFVITLKSRAHLGLKENNYYDKARKLYKFK